MDGPKESHGATKGDVVLEVTGYWSDMSVSKEHQSVRRNEVSRTLPRTRSGSSPSGFVLRLSVGTPLTLVGSPQ